MKNKIRFKKYVTISILLIICFLGLFLALSKYEYDIYTMHFNKKIAEIVGTLKEKYPNITEEEIIAILNNTEENSSSQIFAKYGIDIENSAILLENDASFAKFLIVNLSFMLAILLILCFVFLLYNRKKEKEIQDITKCIEQINKKNYEFNMDSISEDELSILKSEIYKTTIMLKEAAENSNIEKVNLKKSLEDISHQLKTPLTSILVMLDDMMDDLDMDVETRNDFMKDIKREVISINFLVQALLKLSKLDSNTITFTKEKIEMSKLIEEAVKNVSTLCDLKNIHIEIQENRNASMQGDFRWQVEAITNILKNCIDHSLNDSKICISYKQNQVYSSISIKDFGEGIAKEDLPHIFERFFKGRNATQDSIGIGLALSKTIIEKDNGTISVTSESGVGTQFTIKYFAV